MPKSPSRLSPQVRLVFALVVSIGLVVLLECLPNLQDVFRPEQEFTAWLAYAAISAAGVPVIIDGVLLTHPDGFRVAISYGCTPLIPLIFLISILTIGLPLSGRQRLIGIASGITIIIFLNLFRVTTLYYIGVDSPEVFAIAHVWVGQGVIVLGTAIVTGYWIESAARRQGLVSAH